MCGEVGVILSSLYLMIRWIEINSEGKAEYTTVLQSEKRASGLNRPKQL